MDPLKQAKKVTCKLFRDSSSMVSKTIIYVTYQNIATKLSDTYYAEYKKLTNQGLEHLIDVSIEVPANVGQHLEVGVFVHDGDVNPKDFIAQMTPYQMIYICQKSPQDSIGRGRLPGSVWKFELKE